MKIAAFEGFYGGSHRKWLDGFAKHTSHEVRIFQLPDRFWKWRMHGGAVTLARQFNDSEFKPDYLLVTDMLDLNVLLSLTRKHTAGIPVIFYFHENQINYPWSEIDRDVKYERNHHYGFINYASALAADTVLFNSHYHMQAFLGSLPGFLKMFPDYQNSITIEEIKAKSRVLPVGIHLHAFDPYCARNGSGALLTEGSNQGISGRIASDAERLNRDSTQGTAPVILWNHRWEFDKNPQMFFDVMRALHDRGLAYKLIVCGERSDMYPDVFDEIRISLKDHIIHWGYADNFEQYANLLCNPDIVPVTSNQDFFGISAVEAMYCDVFPLLPDRLAFPGHIPQEYQTDHLYTTENDLTKRLTVLLQDGVPKGRYSEWVRRYDWKEVIEEYDAVFGDRV